VIDINKERQKAVREAWKAERVRVRNGSGTREWSQTEQRQIVAKGRAKGYEGHHMKSVKAYPRYAGDSKNIQFLNRSEHVNGAHRGDTKNPTNGYYNPVTKKMSSFGKGKPISPKAHKLTSPLSTKQQSSAIKREQLRKKYSSLAKSKQSRPVQKNIVSKRSNSQKASNSIKSAGTNNVRKSDSRGSSVTHSMKR
jgi:hypothetical protein